MEVNEIIKKRRSIRNYNQAKIITDEQIKTILAAAMLAPSACNCRPWEFLVVRNREKLNQIVNSSPFTKMFASAQFAIIVCANLNLQTTISQGFFVQDCAAASQNILLQAAALDIGTCWCGIYPRMDRVKQMQKLFDLADNIVPFNVIAVGVPEEKWGSRGYYEENKISFID